MTTDRPPMACEAGALTRGHSRIADSFRVMIRRRVIRLSATGGLQSTTSGWSPPMFRRTVGQHRISIALRDKKRRADAAHSNFVLCNGITNVAY